MKYIFIFLVCMLAASVLAAPGDILYVHVEVVNIREGPSTKDPVVLMLLKGHKLLELQRQGEWVEVDTGRTGGKTGWIHSSFIGKELIGGETRDPGGVFGDPSIKVQPSEAKQLR